MAKPASEGQKILAYSLHLLSPGHTLECAATSWLQLHNSILWAPEKVLNPPPWWGTLTSDMLSPSLLISASSRVFIKKDYEASKILPLWEKNPTVYFYLLSKYSAKFSFQLNKISQTSHHSCEVGQIIRYTVKINTLEYSLSIPKQTFDFVQIKWKNQGLRNRVHTLADSLKQHHQVTDTSRGWKKWCNVNRDVCVRVIALFSSTEHWQC